MRKRINAGYIFGGLAVVGIGLVIGTFGALETNLIDIPRAIVPSVLFLGIALIGVLGLRIGGYKFD